MPLRDHSKAPYDATVYMQAIHGRWPGIVMDYLEDLIPARYRMLPTIRMGRDFEIDVSTVEDRFADERPSWDGSTGGLATLSIPQPTLTFEYDTSIYAEFDIKVYEIAGDKLVAAIEFISTSNKDRPDTRAEFASKCAQFWRNRVSVTMIDICISRKFNLYSDILDLLGREDPAFAGKGIPQYAATIANKSSPSEEKHTLCSWAYPLNACQPLPQIPIVLSDRDIVMLDLEATYEKTLRKLKLDTLPGAP